MLGNDAEGDDSAPLDHGSVQLKDPADGTWKTSVTVDGQGTFAVQADGSVRFTPAAGFEGQADQLTYRVADDNGTHAVSTITVTVGHAPTAAEDETSTPQGVPVNLAPLGNDTPGTGATFDPSSLRLVDPTTGDPVTTVVVAGEGTDHPVHAAGPDDLRHGRAVHPAPGLRGHHHPARLPDHGR